MKTAVILSDTHGNNKIIEKLYPLFVENDYIIHLGDGNRDMSEIYRAFPQKTFVCQGNCDVATPYSRLEWEIEIENCKLFCTHGHRYGVKSDLSALKKEAVKRGCNIALYGHTHQAQVLTEENLVCVNPGTAKAYAYNSSYAYLVINDKKITATTVPIML